MMAGKTLVRAVFGTLAVVAVAATIWIISLPNMVECRASGRTVDPTERHCDSATGYEQLQEHATFHAIQVVVMVLVVLLGAYIMYRAMQRLRRRA